MNPKYQKSIQSRQQKEKDKILGYLREMPVKEVALKKAGVGHATYYRWCEEDPNFLAQSEKALQDGVEFINDMNESQMIMLSRDKYWPAIRYWLEHNHSKYMRSPRNVVVEHGPDTFKVEIPYDQPQ